MKKLLIAIVASLTVGCALVGCSQNTDSNITTNNISSQEEQVTNTSSETSSTTTEIEDEVKLGALTEKNKKVANNAIALMDSYINGDISFSELPSITSNLKLLDESSGTVEQQNNSVSINIAISNVIQTINSIEIMKSNGELVWESDIRNEIIDNRNKIAEIISVNENDDYYYGDPRVSSYVEDYYNKNY